MRDDLQAQAQGITCTKTLRQEKADVLPTLKEKPIFFLAGAG